MWLFGCRPECYKVGTPPCSSKFHVTPFPLLPPQHLPCPSPLDPYSPWYVICFREVYHTLTLRVSPRPPSPSPSVLPAACSPHLALRHHNPVTETGSLSWVAIPRCVVAAARIGGDRTHWGGTSHQHPRFARRPRRTTSSGHRVCGEARPRDTYSSVHRRAVHNPSERISRHLCPLSRASNRPVLSYVVVLAPCGTERYALTTLCDTTGRYDPRAGARCGRCPCTAPHARAWHRLACPRVPRSAHGRAQPPRQAPQGTLRSHPGIARAARPQGATTNCKSQHR